MITEYEYNDTHGSSIYGSIGKSAGADWAAGTFTVGSTPHTVTSVKIYLGTVIGSPGTSTLGIRATSGGVPTGSDLTSGTFTPASNQWNTVSVTELALSANTTYAIVVRAPSGGNSAYFPWNGTTNGNGSAYYSTTSGASWTAVGGNDEYAYEVWGNPGGTLYEHFDTANYLSSISVTPTAWFAQSFTVGATGHTVETVQVYIESISGSSQATLHIRATSGGVPTGSDLTSGTFLPATGWNTVSVTKINLSPSTTYAVILSAGSGSGLNWDGVSTGGSGESDSSDSGSSWYSDYPAYKLSYEVWGNPTPTTVSISEVASSVGASAVANLSQAAQTLLTWIPTIPLTETASEVFSYVPTVLLTQVASQSLTYTATIPLTETASEQNASATQNLTQIGSENFTYTVTIPLLQTSSEALTYSVTILLTQTSAENGTSATTSLTQTSPEDFSYIVTVPLNQTGTETGASATQNLTQVSAENFSYSVTIQLMQTSIASVFQANISIPLIQTGSEGFSYSATIPLTQTASELCASATQNLSQVGPEPQAQITNITFTLTETSGESLTAISSGLYANLTETGTETCFVANISLPLTEAASETSAITNIAFPIVQLSAETAQTGLANITELASNVLSWMATIPLMQAASESFSYTATIPLTQGSIQDTFVKNVLIPLAQTASENGYTATFSITESALQNSYPAVYSTLETGFQQGLPCFIIHITTLEFDRINITQGETSHMNITAEEFDRINISMEEFHRINITMQETNRIKITQKERNPS